MPAFTYVTVKGGTGTIDAPDAAAAVKMLPADADPHSGVAPALSGTGNPAPGAPTPTLPVGPVPSPYQLPAAGASGGKSSPLLDFAGALEQAVNLARQHRNEAAGAIMAPHQGTASASDFNGILGNMNAASDKTSEALIKKANDLSSVDIVTSTSDNGDVHGIDKNTGKVIWTAKGVGNAQNSGGGNDVLVRSGALTYSKGDFSDDASALETSRGSDGWVDPAVYKSLYDAWIANSGKIADFVKTFPPAQYVNPENTLLPTYLRPKSTASTNPFEPHQ